MLKAREILRLKHDIELSLREIGSTCRCGKSTVADVLSRAEKAGVTWPIIQNDKQLMSLLYPPIERTGLPPEPDMDYIYHEMKKKNVTLLLLWEEYKEQHAQGIMYTQFCQRYKDFKQQNNVSMHKEHKAGEEMEVDWAGSTIGYYDRITEREKKAYLFVAVLPASSYPFVLPYQVVRPSLGRLTYSGWKSRPGPRCQARITSLCKFWGEGKCVSCLL